MSPEGENDNGKQAPVTLRVKPRAPGFFLFYFLKVGISPERLCLQNSWEFGGRAHVQKYVNGKRYATSLDSAKGRAFSRTPGGTALHTELDVSGQADHTFLIPVVSLIRHNIRSYGIPEDGCLSNTCLNSQTSFDRPHRKGDNRPGSELIGVVSDDTGMQCVMKQWKQGSG